MKYDVFISCKSEDYKYAKQVYDFLVESGLMVFLCDTELRKSHRTMYGRVIEEAIDATDHMIVLASKAEYITSSYVEEEWRLFLEEKRSGRKLGNILTILKGVKIDSLPIGLRHRQSLSYFEFKKELLYYVKSNYQGIQEKEIDKEPIETNQKHSSKILVYSSIIIFVIFLSTCVVINIRQSPMNESRYKHSQEIAQPNLCSTMVQDTLKLQDKLVVVNGEVIKSEKMVQDTLEFQGKLVVVNGEVKKIIKSENKED